MKSLCCFHRTLWWTMRPPDHCISYLKFELFPIPIYHLSTELYTNSEMLKLPICKLMLLSSNPNTVNWCNKSDLSTPVSCDISKVIDGCHVCHRRGGPRGNQTNWHGGGQWPLPAQLHKLSLAFSTAPLESPASRDASSPLSAKAIQFPIDGQDQLPPWEQ